MFGLKHLITENIKKQYLNVRSAALQYKLKKVMKSFKTLKIYSYFIQYIKTDIYNLKLSFKCLGLV